MTDICLPLPKLDFSESAEVHVKLGGRQDRYNFRLESFPWKVTDTHDRDKDLSAREGRFQRFKSSVEDYDSRWELVQIYNPKPRAETIQVLFRQKSG